MHRPAISAHPISTVEGPGKQHVLRAHQHGVPLRMDVPFAGIFPSHEHVKADFIRKPEPPQPLLCVLQGLLDECPHGQAVNEAVWPVVTVSQDAVPEPGQYDCAGLPETRRDVDERRLTCATVAHPVIVVTRTAFAACEPRLGLVRTESRCLREQTIEPVRSIERTRSGRISPHRLSVDAIRDFASRGRQCHRPSRGKLSLP